MINLFLLGMIYTSPEQKVDEKHYFDVWANEETECFSSDANSANFKIQYFYLKLSDATAYSYSKLVVMNALDYIEAVYHDFRIFMQLM